MSTSQYNLFLVSKGNELAFDGFVHEHSEWMYYQAYGILGNKESAEEIVSDVFLEAWKQRKMLTEIDNIKSWLGTIVYRKSISLLRKDNKRKSEMSLDDFPNFEMPHLRTPMDILITKEESDQLHDAIEHLPVKSKRIFYMAKIDQLPYAEICKLTGITLATVNYHISYAMDALRKKLSSLGSLADENTNKNRKEIKLWKIR